MATAIILNGTELTAKVTEPRIICADGGYRLLKDRTPDVILGDFDSLTEIPSGVKIIKVPAEKNYTDGEMAVRFAVDDGETELNIYGAVGGRQDHVFANFALLKTAFCLGAKAKIIDRDFTAEYVEGTVRRSATVGQTVSLLPFGGNITVRASEGLYYPLKNLTITSEGASRGVSNIATAEQIVYDIARGGGLLFFNKLD